MRKSLLLVFAYLFCIQVINAEQPNLISNSDIELSTGWTNVIGSGTIVTQGRTNEESVSGEYSLKTIQENDGTADWRPISNFVIDDSVHYRLRGHIYASNVTTGSHAIEIQWFDSNHTYLGRNKLFSEIANSWIEVMATDITPPLGAVEGYVLLRTYKPGIYFFDDIVFQRKDFDVIDLGDGKFPMALYGLPESQLIFNSDMEEYINWYALLCKGCGYAPSGWDTNIGEGLATMTWDKDNFYTGSRSIKTVMLSAGSVDWRQWVEVESGESYILSASILASNVTQGSHSVEVQWFNDSGYISRNRISSTSANVWTECQSPVLLAPDTASRAVILCRTYKTGTYNFDMVAFNQDRTITDRYTEAYNAGFNNMRFYGTGIAALNELPVGMKASYDFSGDIMYIPSGTDPSYLISIVNMIKNCSSLALWSAPDEPAWRGLGSEGIVNGCDIVMTNDNTPRHPIWINHAAAATPQDEEDFSLLKPYNLSADIVSIDVYPVPTVNSRLPNGNNTISCIGEYVDQLYYNVVNENNTQRSPIWMVLQGFSKGPAVCVELQWFDGSSYISRDTYQPAGAGSWKLISDTNITPPANATRVYILLRTYGGGTYNFDDISFSTGGLNQIDNSDIETGSPASWTTFVGPDSVQYVTQSWDNSSYYSSSHSLKTVMAHGGTADWRQVINVNPANTYSLSAWVKASSIGKKIPTWDDTRFMAYDAIIHGARGLAYFGLLRESNVFTTWPGAQSGLWNNLKKLATEINGTGGVASPLMSGYISFRTVTTGNPFIATLLMEYDDKMYLFVANESLSDLGNITFAISGLPFSSVENMFNTYTCSVSSNQFTDSFDAYEVNIYQIY